MNYSRLRNLEDERQQFDHRLEYTVRVRGTLCLWGSLGITQNAEFQTTVLLHLRNDRYGQEVTIGTLVSGTQSAIGTLQPGECFSIPIQDITGIYASCAAPYESDVYCVITAH